KPLLDHNQWHGFGLEGEEIAFALVDDSGAIAGGLIGYWREGWLFIASISVRSDLRSNGYGRALMQEAEDWTSNQGGRGVWLDSYGFQAPDFYRRLGYQEMGRLRDYLPGMDRLWFVKRLTTP